MRELQRNYFYFPPGGQSATQSNRTWRWVFVCVLCSPGGQSATQSHRTWRWMFVCVFVCVLCSPGGQSATQGHHSWLQPCVGSVHLRTLPWQRRFRRPVGGQRPWRVHLQGPLATVQDDDRSRTWNLEATRSRAPPKLFEPQATFLRRRRPLAGPQKGQKNSNKNQRAPNLGHLGPKDRTRQM